MRSVCKKITVKKEGEYQILMKHYPLIKLKFPMQCTQKAQHLYQRTLSFDMYNYCTSTCTCCKMVNGLAVKVSQNSKNNCSTKIPVFSLFVKTFL